MADGTVGVAQATTPDRLIDNDTDGSKYRQKVWDAGPLGTWGYAAGTNGTVTLSGVKRVLQITAVALGAAGSFTINGGDTITLPYNATDKASTEITVTPRGVLVDPTIVFDANIDSYFVEYVDGT